MAQKKVSQRKGANIMTDLKHPSKGYWRSIYSEIKEGSKAYQCLYANCNWHKKHENQGVKEESNPWIL